MNVDFITFLKIPLTKSFDKMILHNYFCLKYFRRNKNIKSWNHCQSQKTIIDFLNF